MESRSRRYDERRPEARPFQWWSLVQHHREAVGRLLHLLGSAVDALEEPDEPGPLRARPASRIQGDRASQLAFLDGARGTGKTSVALSLRRGLSSRKGVDAMSAIPEGVAIDAPLRAAVERMGEVARDIQPHLVWLPPLDMEPLPEGVNALAALLVRLENAFDGRGERPRSHRGWLTDTGEDDEALVMALDSLRRDVVHAWDGGMRIRSPGQNMHDWADEVVRAERARLDLNERFTDLLDRLAWHRYRRGKPGPLFVQVVDDFDLNPHLCVELLRVVRMVTTPRLFFILAGDLDVASNVMHLKLAGDGARLLNAAVSHSPFEGRLIGTVKATAANNLRKLVPPSHRIELRPLSVSEALALELPGRGCTLEDALDRIRYRSRTGVDSLGEMMKRPWRTVGYGDGAEFESERDGALRGAWDDRPSLIHLNFLRAPVRALIDLAMMLRRRAGPKSTAGADEANSERSDLPSSADIGMVLEGEVLRRLDEAPIADISIEGREAIRGAIRDRTLSTAMALTPITEDTRSRDGAVTYHFVNSFRWSLKSSEPSPDTRLPWTLGAGLALIHDLGIDAEELDRRRWLPDVKLTPGLTLGYAEWTHGEASVAISWPELEWRSVADHIAFALLWSRIDDRRDLRLEAVLKRWLKAWYTVDGHDRRPAGEAFHSETWASTLTRVTLGPALEPRVLVLAMLAPELQWPEELVGELLAAPGVEAWAREAEVAQRVGSVRVDRLELFRREENRAVSRSLPLLSPVGREHYIKQAEAMLAELRRTLQNLQHRPAQLDEWIGHIDTTRRSLIALVRSQTGQITTTLQESARSLRSDQGLMFDALGTTVEETLDNNFEALRFVLERVVPSVPGAFNSLGEGCLCPDVGILQKRFGWPRFVSLAQTPSDR